LFRHWLEYFASKFGRQAVAVAPQYTSQQCSNCGVIVNKSLSTRTHVCSCGCNLHRDENAAINILAKATLGHKESNANGLVTSTLVGASLLEQVTRMKLESPWALAQGSVNNTASIKSNNASLALPQFNFYIGLPLSLTTIPDNE
jgi:putative transposase